MNFLKHKYDIKADEDLLNEIKKIDQRINSKVHLAFMFSMPLGADVRDQNGEIKHKEMPKIDYHAEYNYVYQSLKSTNKNIKIRKICATYNNLVKVLTEGTIALHFAGHGIKNSKDFFNDQNVKNEGDILIFEKEDGTPYYLTEKILKNLLDTSGAEIEFVFVASCHSEKTARLFHTLGARHVICIKES